jgi:ribonuclease VapC
MVIDSSALIAILQDEPEGAALAALLETAPAPMIAAPTRVEASIVVLARKGESGLSMMNRYLSAAAVETITFDSRQAAIAVDAFRRFGRNRHRAGLNFGDCFAYALARATNEPLLFKGDDFVHTDVIPVTA